MPASANQIRRYKRIMAARRDTLSRSLVTAWDELDTYEEADIERYAKRTAPAVRGAKIAAIAASAAFFALATSRPPVGVKAGEVNVDARIREPFLAAWHAVKEDRPWDEALAAGRSMASAIGFDFVQSTARRAGDVAAARSKWAGVWQRVPGSESCEWCVLISGQLYRSSESADFGHDRCDCDVVPTDPIDVQVEPAPVSRTTARGEGRRALGIGTNHPRPGTDHPNPRFA